MATCNNDSFWDCCNVQICPFFTTMWWKIMECLCCNHIIFIRQGHQGTVNKQKANFHFMPSCTQISDKLILVTKIAELWWKDKTKHNFSVRTRMGQGPHVKDEACLTAGAGKNAMRVHLLRAPAVALTKNNKTDFSFSYAFVGISSRELWCEGKNL